MNTQHVDAKTVNAWRWQAAGFALLPVVPLLVGIALAPSGMRAFGVFAYLFVAGAWIWLFPPAYYRSLRYGVDEQGIVIERGIFWKSQIALPRVRIQHTDVAQGPLQRRYGIATLKLYTAGSRFTKIELAGLAHADALALRDALIARGGNSGV